MLDRLRSMEVFVATAEAGSFAAASAQLGMSAQMVARHIQELERRLHVRLINRTTRRQSLSEFGRQYHERCVLALKQVEAADSLALEMLAEPQGELRITAPSQFGSQGLTRFLTGFLTRYPHIDVDLNLSDRAVNLVEEGIEAAFRIGEPQVGESSSLVVRALRPYQLVACAAPDYLAAAGVPERPADLAGHQCLGFVFWDRALFREWVFSRDGESVPVRIDSRLKVNDAHAQLTAALHGGGILLAAEDLLAESLAAGRLVRVLPDYRGPSRPMNLIYAADRLRTPKLKRFIEEALAAFAAAA